MKKIIGIVVLLMLMVPAISAININNYTEKSTIEEDIKITIYKTPGSLGVNIDFENTGETTLTDVDWDFRYKAVVTGTGLLIREKLQKGTFDEIGSGETITLKFRPFIGQTKSPIGFGNLYMNASAKVNDETVRTQKRAFLLGVFIVMYKETYMDISPQEAYDKYLSGDFDLIIDVVGLDIYNTGHLPGAVNYVWANGELQNKIPDLDPTWTYLVYCHTDPPSTASAQLLVNAGFENIYRLEGNIGAWRDAGYPIET